MVGNERYIIVSVVKSRDVQQSRGSRADRVKSRQGQESICQVEMVRSRNGQMWT